MFNAFGKHFVISSVNSSLCIENTFIEKAVNIDIFSHMYLYIHKDNYL